MNSERQPDAFEVRCSDGLFGRELIGVLIGYAHSRGLSVEHDGPSLRLYRKMQVPAAGPAAPSDKIISFAGERLRRGR